VKNADAANCMINRKNPKSPSKATDTITIIITTMTMIITTHIMTILFIMNILIPTRIQKPWT
jgi:hypothetical protein